jgi:hypothetical protein
VSACGPLGTFRPASGFIEERTKELGLGTVAVSPRPYVDEAWAHAGQLWFTGRALPWLHLSAIAEPKAMKTAYLFQLRARQRVPLDFRSRGRNFQA